MSDYIIDDLFLGLQTLDKLSTKTNGSEIYTDFF